MPLLGYVLIVIQVIIVQVCGLPEYHHVLDLEFPLNRCWREHSGRGLVVCISRSVWIAVLILGDVRDVRRDLIVLVGTPNEVGIPIYFGLAWDVLGLLVTVTIPMIGYVILIVAVAPMLRPRTRLVEVVILISLALFSLAKDETSDPVRATLAFVLVERDPGINIERSNDSIAVSSSYSVQPFVNDFVSCRVQDGRV